MVNASSHRRPGRGLTSHSTRIPPPAMSMVLRGVTRAMIIAGRSRAPLTIPVRDAAEDRVPAVELDPVERVAGRVHDVSPGDGDHHRALDHLVVHPDEQGRSLERVHLYFSLAPELVEGGIAPA